MSYSFEHVGLTGQRRQFAFFLVNLLILLPLRSLIAENWIHMASIAAALILVYVLAARRLPEDAGAEAALPLWMFFDLLILLSAVWRDMVPDANASLLSRTLEYFRVGIYGPTLVMAVAGVILLLWGRGQRPAAVTIGQLLVFWAPFVGVLNRGYLPLSADDVHMLLIVPLIWRLVCRISEIRAPSVRTRNADFSPFQK